MAWNGMETRKETDQSVEMKMLAEKYLGKRNNFLSKIEQPQANRKPVEMSMSTRQYLERYGLTDWLKVFKRNVLDFLLFFSLSANYVQHSPI